MEKHTGIYAPDFDPAELGRKSGRITVEKKTGIHAPEMYGVGGRIGGVITGNYFKENSLGLFGISEEQKEAAATEGGNETYKQSVGVHAPELAGYGNHVRWHVNRGKLNPKCAFCCDDTLGPKGR